MTYIYRGSNGVCTHTPFEPQAQLRRNENTVTMHIMQSNRLFSNSVSDEVNQPANVWPSVSQN